MLVKCGGGKGGIKEYLEDGQKSGREYTRDELDQRVTLYGDLETCESIYSGIEGDREKYYHLTFSFKEDHVSEDVLRDVVQSFIKEVVGAAYTSDEVYCYAEAHLPKIKSYTDKKTGEEVERKPHIHLVIPKINLLNGQYLNLFGDFAKYVTALDAWKEKVNNKHGLASPLDHRRIQHMDGSDILSRSKGDLFKGSNTHVKADVLQEMLDRRIETMEGYKALLAEYGKVEPVPKDTSKPTQYYKIHREGDAKGINFRPASHGGFVFSKEFIELPTAEKIALLDRKSEDAYIEAGKARKDPENIEKALTEWRELYSRELKYINSGNTKEYASWKSMDYAERVAYLDQKEAAFYAKYGDETTAGQLVASDELALIGFDLAEAGQKLEQAGQVLKSVDMAQVAANRSERAHVAAAVSVVKELAKSNELKQTVRELENGIARTQGTERGDPRRIGENLAATDRHLDSAVAAAGGAERGIRAIRDARQVERAIGALVQRGGPDQRQAGPEAGVSGKAGVDSVIGQLKAQVDAVKIRPAATGEAAEFDTIKRELQAVNLLNHLSHTKGLNPDKYSNITQGADGRNLIQCGNRNYTVNDFLTKELNLPWPEAKEILRTVFAQQNGDLTPERAQRMSKELFAEYRSWKQQQWEDRKTLLASLREHERQQEGAIRQNATARIVAARLDTSLTVSQRNAAVSLIRMDRIVGLDRLKSMVNGEKDTIKTKRTEGQQKEMFLVAKARQGHAESIALLRQAAGALSASEQTQRASEPENAAKGHFTGQQAEQSQRVEIYQKLDYRISERGDVTYRLDGKEALRDERDRVAVLDDKNDMAIEMGLKLAAQKFHGTVAINGPEDFKLRCVEVAVERGIRVSFSDEKLAKYESHLRDQRQHGDQYREKAQQFNEQRAAGREQQGNEKTQQGGPEREQSQDKATPQTEEKAREAQQPSEPQKGEQQQPGQDYQQQEPEPDYTPRYTPYDDYGPR